MVTAMIGGAVKAALEAGASAELIGVAPRRAMKGEQAAHAPACNVASIRPWPPLQGASSRVPRVSSSGRGE